MGKWLNQAKEIERLRRELSQLRNENQKLVFENQRLIAEANQAENTLDNNANDSSKREVSAKERQLATSGHKVQAVKAYRARTGADLLTAKNIIDSVS